MATKKEGGEKPAGGDKPAAAAEAGAPAEGAAKAPREAKPKGEGKRKKGGGDLGFAIATAEDLKAPKRPPRLRNYYSKEVVPALQKEFGLKNPMQVPRLKKIVLNMGLGEAVRDPKILEGAITDIAKITGQRPVLTKSKKSIATY